MKGAILEKGEKGYTYLKGVFDALNNRQKDFNWLITDCECCPWTAEFYRTIFRYGRYGWLTGDELTEMIDSEDFQWVWAVLSGFEKSIPLEKILAFDLPYADMYKGFWVNPVSIQHPLADIEIVPWDSSCTLLISKDHSMVDDFMNAFPLSRDLSFYNENGGVFDETEELNRWLSEKG